jgi:hypothetical protein
MPAASSKAAHVIKSKEGHKYACTYNNAPQELLTNPGGRNPCD